MALSLKIEVKFKFMNMRKSLHITLVLLLSAITGVFAQNTYNLEFFTQETPPFTVYINGIKQHATSTTNVRVEGFVQPVLKLKVEFDDGSEPLTKSLFMPEQSAALSYQIRDTKKGYKVRFFSETPIHQYVAPPPSPEVVVVPYATVPVITETTTTTTTTTGVGNGGGINVGINGDGVGVNVSVGLGGLGGVYEETITTTTTTTTGVQTPIQQEVVSNEFGCAYPITNADFEEAKQTIEDASFDDTKLSIAKQIVRSNCMTAAQIRDLVSLMSFDDSKLTLAKFAYGYTYDYGNYFKVSQALDFESSIEELNAYIDAYRW